MDSSRMLALFNYYACIQRHSLTYLFVLVGRNREVLLCQTSRNFSREDQAKGGLLQWFPDAVGRQLCSHPSENVPSSSVMNSSTRKAAVKMFTLRSSEVLPPYTPHTWSKIRFWERPWWSLSINILNHGLTAWENTRIHLTQKQPILIYFI